MMMVLPFLKTYQVLKYKGKRKLSLKCLNMRIINCSWHKTKSSQFLDVVYDLDKIYTNLIKSSIIIPFTLIKTRTTSQMF